MTPNLFKVCLKIAINEVLLYHLDNALGCFFLFKRDHRWGGGGKV